MQYFGKGPGFAEPWLSTKTEGGGGGGGGVKIQELRRDSPKCRSDCNFMLHNRSNFPTPRVRYSNLGNTSLTLCKKLDISYRIFCVYFEFTHQESHLRNEPVSLCVYFEYPQPHHVRLEGFTKQCLRIPLCDTLHRIRCWVRTPILFMVY